MSSKHDTRDDGRNDNPVALPDVQVVALEGRDAAAFAQSQFTSDVVALADLQWQWSAWLTPKGRVIALFQLLRLDAEHYWAIVRDMPAQSFATALGRFVFRSKVKLLPLAVSVTGLRDVAATDASIARRVGDAIELVLDRHGARALRVHVLDTDAGSSVDADDADDERALAAWRLDDLALGLPRLEGSAVEGYTPQMLGLDRLAAYSLKKGCYPGQEIVSRTHYLGQAKRGLQRVRLLAPASVGERLTSDVGSSADVASIASDGARHEALLVAALEPTATHWLGDDGAPRAEPLPFEDGLLRGP